MGRPNPEGDWRSSRSPSFFLMRGACLDAPLEKQKDEFRTNSQ